MCSRSERRRPGCSPSVGTGIASTGGHPADTTASEDSPVAKYRSPRPKEPSSARARPQLRSDPARQSRGSTRRAAASVRPRALVFGCGGAFPGSGTRLGGLLPGLGELVAVEEPEDATHEEQHELIERPRNGERSESAAPAKRPRDAAVANDKRYRSKRPADEEACASHAVSLGGELQPEDGGRGGRKSHLRLNLTDLPGRIGAELRRG